jgi:hypothetical protein
VEKQYVLQILSVCVFSLSYPGWQAHAPLCHLWPLWLHHVFPHHLTNGTTLAEMLFVTKYLFSFSQQFFSETFLIPGRIH